MRTTDDYQGGVADGLAVRAGTAVVFGFDCAGRLRAAVEDALYGFTPLPGASRAYLQGLYDALTTDAVQ